MKKIIAFILMLLSFSLVACEKEDTPADDNTNDTPDTGDTGNNNQNKEPEPQPEPEPKKQSLGFATGKIGDFKQYENTSAYVKVTTAQEFLDALKNAKYDYENKWHFEGRDDAEKLKVEEYAALEAKRQDNTITSAEKTLRTSLENELFAAKTPIVVEQNLKTEGTVHVIEIMNDLDLGYNVLTAAECDLSLVNNFVDQRKITSVTMSDVYTTSGISQIKIEQTSNLMIFSKNGSKLTHCGFKMSKCNNVVIRNLEFDEIWQWEDSSSATPNIKVGDYDTFGCAYIKIHSCGYIWIDSCTFGKAYDGLIDIAHPTSKLTNRWSPYGNPDENGVHISNCKFMAGSDDKDGYIYKMMEKIEADYQNNGGQYLYYKTLRDMGATFEDILYGLAIPQKKGFLLCDSGDNYEYNLELKVSFDRCYFKNIQDRLPKIRGGVVYMSNSIIDSMEYMDYKIALQNKDITNSAVQKLNSKYKLSLVSQGIVCGLGASFMAENCKYLGVDALLRNNDSVPSNFFYEDPSYEERCELLKAQYALLNVQYQRNKNDLLVSGHTDKVNTFEEYNSEKPTLLQTLTAQFNWRNTENKKPFEVELIHQNILQKDLLEDNPIGTKENFDYNNYL